MLIIVRHGRTKANAQGLLLGRADPALDEVGLTQAESISAALQGDSTLHVSRVVVSPLLRTTETGEVLASPWGCEVEPDDRWLELDYGSLDGTPVAEVPAQTWQQWRSDQDFAPPGGESHRSLSTRVQSACEDLIDEATTTDIVVVTHVSPIKSAVGWALGMGLEIHWRSQVSVASISRILGRGQPPTPALLSFNETAHLSI